ncbi:hypothetical protein K435DRAFT_462146 [Dendrothele bispora CBS 962.96]|uniref:Uncharacterized protein n=1 Tax=Dendrothele bispora (strain CBS 962.96) TaxID=1314807 RepID=A0A4S8MCN6_DENBC|nr:hypothetical protein K435DRAFT_462146 [Dendrothele bispora CBS 962.96]
MSSCYARVKRKRAFRPSSVTSINNRHGKSSQGILLFVRCCYYCRTYMSPSLQGPKRLFARTTFNDIPSTLHLVPSRPTTGIAIPKTDACIPKSQHLTLPSGAVNQLTIKPGVMFQARLYPGMGVPNCLRCAGVRWTTYRKEAKSLIYVHC